MKISRHFIRFFVLITIVLLSLSAPMARADIDEGVEYKKVEVGESVWRYWKNPGSDTCLIWLGGGIFTQQLFINPYSLESYNTMYLRFV